MPKVTLGTHPQDVATRVGHIEYQLDHIYAELLDLTESMIPKAEDSYYLIQQARINVLRAQDLIKLIGEHEA